MRLAIFGGTGKTGQHLIEQALAAGHEVTALVRSAAKLAIESERLSVVVGDALNGADVARTVTGADAVIGLIGPTKGGAKDVASRSTAHILTAMEQHVVPRLVITSVGGIPTSDDQRGPLATLLGNLIKAVLGGVFADRERQLELLRESKVAWVALRLPRLIDDPATGHYELGYTIKPGYKIARADVATALLDQLTDDTYIGHAPIVHQ